jgi:hypothetical protein
VFGSVELVNNHHKLRRMLCEPCAQREKSPGHELMIPENMRLSSWTFPEKFAKAGDNSGKCSITQLRISKKVQVTS